MARSKFPSQNLQNTLARTTFGSSHVEKVYTVLARSTFRSQKCKKQCCVRTTFGRSDAVWRGRRQRLCTLSKVRKRSRFCSSFNNNYNYNTLHYITLNDTTLHYTTLHHAIDATLHYTTLHSGTLRSTTHTTPPTLHYTHYATLHSTTLNYTNYN